MKPPRSNPNGVVQESPGLARRQPWVIARRCPSTPTGLRPAGRKTGRLRSPPATTPLGLGAPPSPLPRVVPSVQPWALLHNRVAVEATGASLGWESRKISSRASHRRSIPVCSPGNLSLTRMSFAATPGYHLAPLWVAPRRHNSRPHAQFLLSGSLSPEVPGFTPHKTV